MFLCEGWYRLHFTRNYGVMMSCWIFSVLLELIIVNWNPFQRWYSEVAPVRWHINFISRSYGWGVRARFVIFGCSSPPLDYSAFWYVKICIFWKCIQCTIHWNKTQIFRKFPSDKICSTKMRFFFLLRAPTHHSFIFNLWFLWELKHKVCLSKTVYRICHFWFHFIFIKVYIFSQQNAWTLWL